MKRNRKEPLYRKENKSSLSTHYYVRTGEDFRHDRNTKKMKIFDDHEGSFKPMKSGKYGFDYTPLFRFLLSKVGKKWDDVYSAAVERLNDTKPIFWMVELVPTKSIFRFSESTNYHTLTVDENGILVYVDKDATITASCPCCTHTLDGRVVKYVKFKEVENILT